VQKYYYNDGMEILKVDSQSGKKIVKALEEGKVLVCPTDTVYGLIADATNKKAVARVFQIKGREKTKSIPIFVKDLKMAKQLARITKQQEQFLEKVWPGKVTALLLSKQTLPHEIEITEKIGLRIPDYPLIAAIFKKFNRPLTGTSANISGFPSCSDSADVIRQFKARKHQPDILIDAGTLPKSKPSKVVDITEPKQKIIRK